MEISRAPIPLPHNNFSGNSESAMNFHHSFSSPFIHSWMLGNVENSTSHSNLPKVPSLVALCQSEILQLLERSHYNSRLVKDLCKYVPEELMEPIFEKLIESKKITDVVLLIYLSPHRHKLIISNVPTIRNSIFKLIGYNCPNLSYLDLSDCVQISNSVVRTILTGCPSLECLKLDRCQRVTDSAFDLTSTPFQSFVSCLSLQAISLQGCPQITGEVISILNKNYRNLSYLNFSQCKHLKASEIPAIFQHQKLALLNLSFIESVSDETFAMLPIPLSSQSSRSSSTKASLAVKPMIVGSSPIETFQLLRPSPLQVLNLCKCRITDDALAHFATLNRLIELRLPWCNGVTDAGIMLLVEYCPLLQVLDVTSCSISDLALQSIGKLAKRQLRELDLSWCMEITNQGLRYLLPLYGEKDEDYCSEEGCGWITMVSGGGSAGMSLLEKISLVWCPQVNDESLMILSHLSSLKYLALNGCNEVSSEAMQRLSERGIEVTR